MYVVFFSYEIRCGGNDNDLLFCGVVLYSISIVWKFEKAFMNFIWMDRIIVDDRVRVYAFRKR